MARSRSVAARCARLIGWLVLACVLSSILAVAVLRWINPPLSAFMIESRLEALASHDRSYLFRHTWVDLDHISPNLALAVVASEDQKFPEHWGFDVEAIEKAYELNQHRHHVHGASTISQQVAKNLYLWSGRSYFRKGLEAYFTVLIEALWPKRRILEIYLNIAEFGHGTFGAGAAAERYFHKSAARLSRADAAVLAAVLPNPTHYSAVAPSRYVAQRRDWILQQMQALGGPEMLSEIDAYPDRRR
ncbi:MAG TPA: monofunctional biosynthetic peptidoglycan transglycosylase [Steroidobacteraceae bacterium]|nr:monofunctional biosynthetic peptidoglycan transglycosylase [Steroidobacteraceae bacterium]